MESCPFHEAVYLGHNDRRIVIIRIEGVQIEPPGLDHGWRDFNILYARWYFCPLAHSIPLGIKRARRN
jgi:hypothetical protein